MDKGLISDCEDCHFRQAFYSNEHDTLKEALEAQIIEYESRGQVLYAGLGAPSSIRLVYDLLGKDKPTDLPPIKNERMDTLKAKADLLDESVEIYNEFNEILNAMILNTPSGDQRNFLTILNIKFLEILRKTEALK